MLLLRGSGVQIVRAHRKTESSRQLYAVVAQQCGVGRHPCSSPPRGRRNAREARELSLWNMAAACRPALGAMLQPSTGVHLLCWSPSLKPPLIYNNDGYCVDFMPSSSPLQQLMSAVAFLHRRHLAHW